jgi:cytochrome d ubiquinol oxidase subunit I
MELDALSLARWQFGFTAFIHFIYVPLTIGLGFFIAIMKTLYLKSGDKRYDDLSMFFMKLFAINFAIGVATGLTMEFEFGTNWSEYSKLVGDIFGAPLALEGLTAFFLESTFMGIFLFGRNKVSEKVHLLSAWMVAIGGSLSALWILIANSWQQTPEGFRLVETPQGIKAELTDFWAAVVNHSSLIRFLHTVDGAFITAGFFVMGVSAFYLIKKRHTEMFKLSLKLGLIFTTFSALIQILFGDIHGNEVAHYQPLKLAMVEGKWETEKCASLDLFGIIDQEKQESKMLLKIPCLLSILSYHDPNAEVKGIKDLVKEYQEKSKEYKELIPILEKKMQEAENPEEKRKIQDQLVLAKAKAHALNITFDDLPSVPLVFTSFHLMVYLGFYFAFVVLLGWWLLKRGTLYTNKDFLWLLLLSIPLPFFANELGWMSAEIGRQPWLVYGILQTKDGVSFVPASQVFFSVMVFTFIYLSLLVVYLFLMAKAIGKGPKVSSPQAQEPTPNTEIEGITTSFSKVEKRL